MKLNKILDIISIVVLISFFGATFWQIIKMIMAVPESAWMFGAVGAVGLSIAWLMARI